MPCLLVPFLAIAIGAAYEDVPMDDVVPGNTRFALELFGKLQNRPGNLFFSPGSLSTALAMTYAGAREETAQEMARTLHFSMPQERLHAAFGSLLKALDPGDSKRGYRLSIANRLWGKKGLHYLPAFLSIVKDQYRAGLEELDFTATEQARSRINDWVERQTEGKIVDLIPPDVLDARTRLVLTNAIYFKGDWSTPFPKGATKEEPFHLAADRAVPAPLMHRQENLRFWAGDGLKALELPYGEGDLSMVVLLPDAIDGLPALETGLAPEKLDKWIAGLRSKSVQVALPRFKMTSQFTLGDVLTKMGMPLAFDQLDADFSGMTIQEELYIEEVVHKAFVDVNEEGTEAAAATGVIMAPRAMAVPTPPVVFRADHPFLFLIRDTRSGSLLFLGRMADPRG
ncbi:serpin family protein [Tundrisphaera lichenicola]|uniref:serpin family protein n=1 Tax=Tundrisphaera lichenicola TaxID=2029860 RepID=UPI003EC00A0B